MVKIKAKNAVDTMQLCPLSVIIHLTVYEIADILPILELLVSSYMEDNNGEYPHFLVNSNGENHTIIHIDPDGTIWDVDRNVTEDELEHYICKKK